MEKTIYFPSIDHFFIIRFISYKKKKYNINNLGIIFINIFKNYLKKKTKKINIISNHI